MSRWISFEINATLYCIKNYFHPRELRKIVLNPPNDKGDADTELHCNIDEILFLQLKSREGLTQFSVRTPALKEAIDQLLKKFLNFYPKKDTIRREYVAVIEGYGDENIQKLHYCRESRDYLAIKELENGVCDILSSVLDRMSETTIRKVKSAFLNHLYVIDTPKLDDIVIELKAQYSGEYGKIIEILSNPPQTITDKILLIMIAGTKKSSDSESKNPKLSGGQLNITETSHFSNSNNPNENSQSENQREIKAFCCGKPMIVTKKRQYMEFKCATGSHRRSFKISLDPSKTSICSCESGRGKMETADLGTVRLYSCPTCGARYSVFIGGLKIETNVEGISANEVSYVSERAISQMWDRLWSRDIYGKRNNCDSFFNKDVQNLKDKIKNANDKSQEETKVDTTRPEDHHTSTDFSVTLKQLETELKETASGLEDAHRYYRIIAQILEILFNDMLADMVIENETQEGLIRRDIVFRVLVKQGFFNDIQIMNSIFCPYLKVECKNYSDDPKNPEYGHLTDRLNPTNGMLGFLVVRYIEDKEKTIAHCRTRAREAQYHKVIIVLDDTDISELIEAKIEYPAEIATILHRKIRELLF